MALFNNQLLNPFPSGPIARGGHVFLPQNNVSVRIQQIQLEQVTFNLSLSFRSVTHDH